MAVTPQIIAVALGRAEPSATEEPQWQMWIEDAEMLIEARRVALDVVGPLDPVKLDYVVREAVVARARRPDDGATSVTVAIQDASTTKQYGRGGSVTILDEWWSLLGLTSPNGGAWSIDTAWGAGVHAAICALNFGSTYCSCGADLTNYAYPLFEYDGSIGLIEGWPP